MKLLGYPFYFWYLITGQRARWKKRLQSYGAAEFTECRRTNHFRIAPNFPPLLELDDYPEVVGFLSEHFHQFALDFVSVFQSGNAFYDWIIRLGIYLGDFVILHSINPAEWVKDAQGCWVVQFNRSSGPFQWSPFAFVEKRYFFGEPEDFHVSMDIFKKLKC